MFSAIIYLSPALQSELMGTPDARGNAGIIVSRMTVGSLEDLGYAVNYDLASQTIEVSDECKCPSNIRQRRTKEERTSSFLDEYFPAHGDTRQILDSQEGRGGRRQLSAAMKDQAITHGRKILYSKRRHLETLNLPNDVKYVGDKVVAVTVRDHDGSVHSVVVRHED